MFNTHIADQNYNFNKTFHTIFKTYFARENQNFYKSFHKILNTRLAVQNMNSYKTFRKVFYTHSAREAIDIKAWLADHISSQPVSLIVPHKFCKMFVGL